MKFSLLLLFCFLCPIFAAKGFYGGGGDRSISSSSSSESHEGGRGGRGGHGHGGRPRPPRPPVRPRPPREKTNCPTDWMLFNRTQGNWCVKVFVGKGLNQVLATAQCVAQGAVLTGLQTTEERLKVAEAAKTLVIQNGFATATVWLGCKRKAACPTVHICPARDTFEWTDGQTTGYVGFEWALTQPDASFRSGWGHQSCCHQFVFPSGTTSPVFPGFFHGQLDDMHCLEQWTISDNKMYACGKLAT